MGKTLVAAALALAMLVPALLSGCSVIRYKDEILLLKQMGDEQRRMDMALRKQHELFRRLQHDIRRQRLAGGMSKESVFAAYGQPLECRPSDGREQCLYRDPRGSPSPAGDAPAVIHLYFGPDNALLKWENFSDTQAKTQ